MAAPELYHQLASDQGALPQRLPAMNAIGLLHHHSNNSGYLPWRFPLIVALELHQLIAVNLGLQTRVEKTSHSGIEKTVHSCVHRSKHLTRKVWIRYFLLSVGRGNRSNPRRSLFGVFA